MLGGFIGAGALFGIRGLDLWANSGKLPCSTGLGGLPCLKLVAWLGVPGGDADQDAD